MRWGLAVVLVLAVCAVALAQEPGAAPSPDRPITLELRDAQVADALSLLFRGSGYNYVLESATSGTVTVTLRDVPWRRALQAVLDVANLTYRQEDNIYHISARAARPTRPPMLEEPRPVVQTPPAQTVRPAQAQTVGRTGRRRFELVIVRYSDPGQMAMLFGGTAVGGGYGGGYNSLLSGLGGSVTSGYGGLPGNLSGGGGVTGTYPYYQPGGSFGGIGSGPYTGSGLAGQGAAGYGGYPGTSGGYGGYGGGYGGYGGGYGGSTLGY
jgi:hypothetical protein